MKKYSVVAMGGTFNIIHKGHLTMLTRAFEVSSHVMIGLVSDDMAKRNGKNSLSYEIRYTKLVDVLKTIFESESFKIYKLEEAFGPAAIHGEVEALIVSQETEQAGIQLNKLRKQHNLKSIDVITVPTVLAHDGKKISSTRIRNSEIDKDGMKI